MRLRLLNAQTEPAGGSQEKASATSHGTCRASRHAGARLPGMGRPPAAGAWRRLGASGRLSMGIWRFLLYRMLSQGPRPSATAVLISVLILRMSKLSTVGTKSRDTSDLAKARQNLPQERALICMLGGNYLFIQVPLHINSNLGFQSV